VKKLNQASNGLKSLQKINMEQLKSLKQSKETHYTSKLKLKDQQTAGTQSPYH